MGQTPGRNSDKRRLAFRTDSDPVEHRSREVEHRIPEMDLRQVMGRFTEVLPEKYLVVFALRDVQVCS